MGKQEMKLSSQMTQLYTWKIQKKYPQSNMELKSNYKEVAGYTAN